MFDVRKNLINVQGGRKYLPVSARLVWFREEHPDWGITTAAVTIDTEKQFAIFSASVYDAGGKLMGTGTKMEDFRDFPDYVEKAETGAIGRALAVCGYGTQFEPALDELSGTARRYVDSPREVSDGAAYQPGAPVPVALAEAHQCKSCRRELKASQESLSLRKYGAALCPDCQKALAAAGNRN